MRLPRKEANAAYYDKAASRPSCSVHYTNIGYYLIYLVVLDRLRHSKNKRILDLGCGSGFFSHALKDQGFESYVGIDFSPSMLRIAKSRNTDYEFLLRDLNDSDSMTDLAYDIVTTMEFVEHVDEDLAILERVVPGSRLLISSTNDPGIPHVRFFPGIKSMQKRYRHLYVDPPDSAIIVCGLMEYDESVGIKPFWKKYFILDGTRCG